MAVELVFDEDSDSVSVSVSRIPSLSEGMLSALVAGTVVGISVFHFAGYSLLIPLVIIGSTTAFVLSRRKTTAKLSVTNLSFALRGRVGDNFGDSRSVSRADVRWLEYQEDTSGPETSHHPGGLYAVLSRGSVCVLPYVDAEQAAQVIDRIMARFPDFHQQCEGQSAFGQHFTSLGLDPPKETEPRADGPGQGGVR